MAKGDDGHRTDQEDGYRRPPVKHQIKPKEVRNPWGRKGKPLPERDFLDEPFDLRIDGKSLTVSRRLALDYALFNSALTKPRVSTVKELERRAQERARATNDNAVAEALSTEEKAAFDRCLQRRIRELQAQADGSEDQNLGGGRGARHERMEDQKPEATPKNFVPGVKK